MSIPSPVNQSPLTTANPIESCSHYLEFIYSFNFGPEQRAVLKKHTYTRSAWENHPEEKHGPVHPVSSVDLIISFVCLFVCIAVGIECLDHGASLRRGEVLCFLWFDPLWFSMFLPCWNEGVLRKLRYFRGNNFSWHAGYLFEIFNLKRMWATLGPKYQSHVKNYLYDRFLLKDLLFNILA